MLTIDDFVMLGKTVPEPNSDGRVFVCSAGYSPTLRSLIRIYPLAMRSAPPSWSVNTVRLERNDKDTRAESFSLAGDRAPGQHDLINCEFVTAGAVLPDRRAALFHKSAYAASIDEANRQRRSLAIVHAESMAVEFEYNPDSPDSPQLALFDVAPRPTLGAKRFPFIPRLRFKDVDGEHLLMLRDWGVFELMRKHNNLADMTETERRRYLAGALHLDSSCSLLVGNFNRHYTAWLVIAVLHGLRSAPSLFDEIDEAA